VADPGSVRVSDSFNIERYPTVFQMTSTVKATTSVSFLEIMKALYPCASITGAPKVRTMEIIKEVELGPRGIYTGSIGYIGQGSALGKDDAERVARFNVAIRTVLVDKKTGTAEYGVGGGVVWDSDAPSEYAECLAKAAVLNADIPDFDLLETILWDVDDGYFLLDAHVRRLMGSAEYFDYKLSASFVLDRLQGFSKEIDKESCVVRLLVSRKGVLKLETRALPDSVDKVFDVELAGAPVDVSDPFLYHKTTNRSVYENAKAACADCDDVILYNEQGEITEGTIANVVLNMGGRLLTPPVSSGLLAGTFRDHLIEAGEIEEQVLSLEDLSAADEIFLVNSVRKWIPVKLSVF
ncbi:MAG: aminotransferase class IV, partial [Kiritimatiellae bacterium]|nr:aminotransferase class IV [Kiritimatiellia bacterium]